MAFEDWFAFVGPVQDTFITLTLIILPTITVTYLCALILYRLFLSPLAKFPGPKLAAATGWYETYYELFKGIGGQYTFHIQKLHGDYGPIVRINPNEVHIDDPEFYDTLYTQNPGYDKPRSIQHRFGSPYAAFSTPQHETHRARRAPMSPFFSKRKIMERSPAIHEEVDRLCSRLATDSVDTGKPIVLGHMFTCYVADVVTKYAFDKSYDFLSQPDFVSPFTSAVRGFKDIVHPCAQFPWLPRIMAKLPDELIVRLQPAMASVVQFQEEMRQLIRTAQGDLAGDKEKRSSATIFDGILRSELPPQELSVERLKDEAVSIIGAGIASAEWTSTLACFHILNDSAKFRRLRAELMDAIPDPQRLPSLTEIEKLPYLMACVEESLRLACGQMARSPRISRSSPIIYKHWIIPKGVTVSMDTWSLHHNESIYPKSFDFVPERWLGSPKGPDGKRPLGGYMTAFGRGTRICLGLNLARAEVSMVLAALFRRFDLELFETDCEDVRIVRDVLAPDPRPDSRGVRVLVKSSSFIPNIDTANLRNSTL